MPFEWSDLNPGTWWGQVKSRFHKDTQPGGLFGPSTDQARQRELAQQQAEAANNFANFGQDSYGALTTEAAQAREGLRRLASGQDSLSAEQLRQGLQQNVAAQRSMAAGAAPQNQAMAARTAAMQAGRLGQGMAGQQALAGIQERQAAQQGLSNMILGQRGQDANVALGSRQNANAALGAYKPDPSTMEKLAGVAGPLAMLFSDKRLKKDIDDGDKDANAAMKGLRAFTYAYKDDKHGKGKQLGILAQDLERVGLKQAVVETPVGKAVDVGKLSGANTAMLSALERRVAKIESKK